MSSCVFCAIIAQKIPASVVYEDEDCVAFMDIFPLRPGHVLVVPKRHAQYVHELEEAERGSLMAAGNRVAKALRASRLQPAALHFNINDGVAANQTVPHVHLHLLPRYSGDNFGFIGSLLKKPLQFLLKPEARDKLDAQAADIRQYL